MKESLIKRKEIVENLYQDIELQLKGALLSIETLNNKLYEKAKKEYLKEDATEQELTYLQNLFKRKRDEHIQSMMFDLENKLKEATVI